MNISKNCQKSCKRHIIIANSISGVCCYFQAGNMSGYEENEKDLLGIPSSNASIREFEEMFVESKHTHEVMLWLNSKRKKDQAYCDASLEADGKTYFVHRAILASKSKHFDNLFAAKLNEESGDDPIQITGVEADVMDLILTFLYTGEIVMNQDNVYNVMAAAHDLDLRRLMELSSEFLMKHKSIDECIKIWLASRRYNANDLEMDLKKFINLNYDVIYRHEDFLKLSFPDVMDVIQLKNDDTSGEESACKAVLAWVKHDMEKRADSFEELFSFLNLKLLTKLFLAETVAKEDLVRQNRPSFVKTMDAMRLSMMREIERPNLENSLLVCSEDFKVFRIIDIETNAQEIISRRDEARFEACPVVLLGHLYLIGGYITSKDEPTNTVVKLDLRKPEEGWKKIASMKYPRRKAKATRHTNSIKVEGGIGGFDASVTMVETFSTKCNLWSSVFGQSSPLKADKTNESCDSVETKQRSSGIVLDACKVKKKVVAKIEAQDAEGTYQYLALCDGAQKSWRALCKIGRIQDFYKLVSL